MNDFYVVHLINLSVPGNLFPVEEFYLEDVLSWYVSDSFQSVYFYVIILLDFIYTGSLFSIFTTLIYHKVLINNKTEQDTEQYKQAKILVEQFTYILTHLCRTLLNRCFVPLNFCEPH